MLNRITAFKTWYVYTYAFPDGTVFYVGKGNHARIDDHERKARNGCDCDKCRIIRQIWESGHPVQKRIVFKTLCKSFYSMGGILILKWAVKRAIGYRKRACPALLAVSGFLRTRPFN